MEPRRGLLTIDPLWPPIQSVSCWKADLRAVSKLTQACVRLLELNSLSLSLSSLFEFVKFCMCFLALSKYVTVHPVEQLPLNCIQVAAKSVLLFGADTSLLFTPKGTQASPV